MKPRIIFDARMMGAGGIGRYVESLIEAMLKLRPEISLTVLGDPARIQKFGDLGASLQACRRGSMYSPFSGMAAARMFEGFDLAHVPHFNVPAALPVPFVLTLHDIIHLQVPEYEPFPFARIALRTHLKKIIRRSEAIIAVSRSAGDEITLAFPKASGKTCVIAEGAHEQFGPGPSPDSASIRERYQIKRPYFLFVGALREHKRPMDALRAYALLPDEIRQKTEFIFAGNLDRRYDQKHFWSRVLATTPGARHITGFDDRVLAELYRGALALVMPSSHEGFGLPLVETMRSGVPAIVSDIGPLREIAGDSALYFPVGQIDALREWLYNVATNPNLKKTLSERGLERSKSFVWPETARLTLELYERTLRAIASRRLSKP